MSSLATNPARLFTTLARAEMVTWTLLILGMIGKYVLNLGGLGVSLAGPVHGFVFLSYALVTVLVGHDDGKGPIDSLVGTVVRRPIPSALVSLVVIALVFSGLLAAGPPTQWFA